MDQPANGPTDRGTRPEDAKLHFDDIKHSPIHSESANMAISSCSFVESIRDRPMDGFTDQWTNRQTRPPIQMHGPAMECIPSRTKSGG